MSPLFGFGLGHVELLIIAGVALLLFGHRLPSVMRSMGRGLVEFKKGVQGIEDDTNSTTSGAEPSSQNSEANKT